MHDIITPANITRLTELAHVRRGWISDLAWSPNGAALAVAHGAAITLLVADTLEARGTLAGHAGPVKNIAVSRDGFLIASGSADTTARLWDLRRGGAYREFTGHADAVEAVALSPDDTRLAAASRHTVTLWDITGGTAISHLRGHQDVVTSLAFLPDGRSLAAGSWDKSVKIWDISDERVLISLPHEGWVRHVSLRGSTLVSASRDGAVWLWDTLTGQLVRRFAAHEGGADAAALSPDGTLLATAGRDHTVKFWDAASGQRLHTLRAQDRPVLALAWSPDGTRLATGSGDHTVRVWRVKP